MGLHGGNIVLPEGAAWGNGEGATAGTDNALWYDINTTDPKERIKYLTCWMHVPKTQQLQGLTHSLQVSDGVTWSNPVACNAPAGDYGSIFYNPFRSKWVQSIKRDGPRGRCRYYVESDRFLDGADWSKAVYWTNADRLDRPEPANSYAGNASQGDPPQLYSLAAVAYESLLIGMHQIHRGPRNEICAQGKFPKLTDLELGFSRDGFHWDRPDRRGFIRGAREPGVWDRAYLFVNIHAPQGELRVELLDSSGKVLATSRPVIGDSTKQRIEWLDQPDLAKWSGKPVRFRFQLSNGQLYSFWVTEDAGGASNGYVGAGGPGFSGVHDVISSNSR